MTDLFKQNLLTLRSPSNPKTFAQALMGNASWAKPQAKVVVTEVAKESFSEKTHVLESLERFAVEKSETLGNKFSVEGGEVLIKEEPSWTIGQHNSLSELLPELSLASEIIEINLKNKNPKSIRVLFVTETFREWGEVKDELKGGFLDELITAFPLKTAELFSRMIGAMKLNASEVLIYPVEIGDKDLSAEVMSLAGLMKPEVIVTLGAKATQRILKGQDRLTLVHGQFFSRKIENIGTFNVVPLFHPSIIETNQNMKKTAWADMQKIMKFLKILP